MDVADLANKAAVHGGSDAERVGENPADPLADVGRAEKRSLDAQVARQMILEQFGRDDRVLGRSEREPEMHPLHEIAAALRGSSSSATTGEDGLHVVRVLRAATRSLASDGARVTV